MQLTQPFLDGCLKGALPVRVQKYHMQHLLSHSGKDKAIPLQAWTGPEDSRRLRLPDFMKIGT
jgi:hypothetical protein